MSEKLQLHGIPTPTLGQQIDHIIYQRNRLREIVGELIATVLINLERGSLTCQTNEMRLFTEARRNVVAQLMNESDTFASTNQPT